jgi:hypothetical protein
LLRVDGHAQRAVACCCCACSSRSARTPASRKKPRALGPLAPSLAHDEPRLRLRYRNPMPRLRASLSTCSPSSRANIRLRRRRVLLRHHPRPPVPLRGSLFSEPAEPTAPLAPLSRDSGRGVCSLRDPVLKRLNCARFPWAPEVVSGPSQRTPLLYHGQITMSSEPPPDSEIGPRRTVMGSCERDVKGTRSRAECQPRAARDRAVAGEAVCAGMRAA